MAPGRGSFTTPAGCLICGERGGSDAIANTILFLPLGIALGLQRWRVAVMIVFAGMVTLFIESSQMMLIPGRDAGIGDLVFNTTGAILGIAAVRSSRLWILPSGSVGAILTLLAGAFSGGLILTAGLLFQPDFEASAYRSQWTQRRSRSDVYRGEVHSVRIGDASIPPGTVEDPDRVRTALVDRQPIIIEGTAGARPRGTGPIYTIRAQRNRDIWTAAQRGEALLFHYRTRAADLRLQEPDLIVDGMMGSVAEGDPFVLTVREEAPGFRVKLNDREEKIMFGPRHGWRLFLYPFGVPRSLRWMLDYVWLGLLALPLGYWATSAAPTIGGLGLLSGALVTTSMARLFPGPTALEVAALLVGLATGLAARLILKRFAERSHKAGAA